MIFKYIKNNKKKKYSVDTRYKYVISKSDWTAENTIMKFNEAVKAYFDKHDTTHLVLAFDRLLTNEEKKIAREIISTFFFIELNDFFVSISEHNDNAYTHYHILISRNRMNGKMFNSIYKRTQYIQFQKSLRERIESAGLLDLKEKAINQKYFTKVQERKIKRQLSSFEYKQYQKLRQLDNKTFLRFLMKVNKNKNLYRKISKKAFLRSYVERLSIALYKKDYELARELRRLFTVNIVKEDDEFFVEIDNYRYNLEKLSKLAYTYMQYMNVKVAAAKKNSPIPRLEYSQTTKIKLFTRDTRDVFPKDTRDDKRQEGKTPFPLSVNSRRRQEGRMRKR